MDLIRIVSELRREKEAVEEALIYLEQLARTRHKRRGRPPAYLTGRLKGVQVPRKRFSEETRRKMSQAQKKRWAAARAAAKKEK
jgi:hypothetical protein